MTQRARRRRKQPQVESAQVSQLPFKPVVNRFPPICAISDDEVEFIHQSSLTVLEQVGVEIMSPEGRKLLVENGRRLLQNGDVVYIERGWSRSV